MREFIVKKGVIGYIVNIGCQVAGFTTKEDLLKAITEYVNDPGATEKKYYVEKYPRVRDLPDIDHRTFGMTATQVAAKQQGGSDTIRCSTHPDGIILTDSGLNGTATQTLSEQLHNAYTEHPTQEAEPTR
jgi:hypothetical protein